MHTHFVGLMVDGNVNNMHTYLLRFVWTLDFAS